MEARVEVASSVRDEETKQARSYDLETPLFQRHMLEKLCQQLTLTSKGKSYINSHFEEDRIFYRCLQYFANPCPGLEIPTRAVSIHRVEWEEPPKYTLIGTKSVFKHHRQAWEESEACIYLKQLFANVPILYPIKKVICFGLGPLSWDFKDSPRSHAQHAAVITLAETLRERTGDAIQCYAQDPWYNSIDKEVLNDFNIEILTDPKGFLEVDINTLVISFSPNVPVRQIVTDLQWPAAMIWHPVETEEKREWKKINGSWIAPFSTDPSSPRVQAMIQNYKQEPFLGGKDLFGNVAVYFRHQ